MIRRQGTKTYTKQSVIFRWLPWVGFEPTTHCVLGRCSTNWATRAAQLYIVYGTNCPKYIHMHLHYAYLSVCMSSLSYSVFECCSLHWKKRPLSNSKLNKGPLSAMKHTSIRTHEEFFWLNYLGGLVPPNGVEPGNKANIWQPKYSDPPPIRTPSAQIKVAPLHPLHKHTLHVRVIPLNATQ